MSAIRAQRFDIDGNKVGGEFLVNSTILDNQMQPAVTVLADGRFVISWIDGSERSDTRGFVVRAQVYEADGDRSGAELTISSATAGHQENPTLAALSDGRFVAVWQVMAGMSFEIHARIWNADGTPAGNGFLVDATITGLQDFPAVTTLSDGRFVVAWDDWSTTGNDTVLGSIRAQIFDHNGVRLGTDFLVNTHTAGSQTRPDITSLTDGRFVVTWEDSEGDSSGYAIRAQIFEASGHPAGDEFIVNTVTDLWQWRPKVAALPGGGFVATWGSDAGDASTTSWELHAQVFDADGEKSGDELTVGALSETPLMTTHAVTALSNGRFVVNWQTASSTGGDTDGNSVHAQIFGFGNGAPVITSDGGGEVATILVAESTTAVTAVSATDPDGSTAFYTIAGGADSPFFNIDHVTGQLSFLHPRDFEMPADAGANNSYEVVVAANDGTLSDLQTIVVTITDVNDAPAIISYGGYPSVTRWILENGAEAATITAEDPDGDALTYSIVGGADAALFQIDAATGALWFINAPDYEAPADADHNNSYVVQLRASDGELFAEQAVTIGISDTAESGAPVITSNGGGGNATVSIAENARAVTTVAATDPDNDTIEYAIVGGADAGLFQIDEATGALSFINAPDFETPADADQNNSYVVEVCASDGIDSDEQTITVNVTDVTTPHRHGDEIQVNTTTDSFQEQPTIVGLANGRFVVAWRDGSTSPDDPSWAAIRAQVFNADGSKAGPEFLVNTTTLDEQNDPAITALDDGSFAVTWLDSSESGGDTSATAIRAQVFGPNGARIGSELLINTTTADYQQYPSIAALPGGRIVATWTDASETGDDTNEHAIRARVLDAAGGETVAEFVVNTSEAGSQYDSVVTALPGGNFVIAWADLSQSGGDQSGSAVRAQVFQSNGMRVGSELLINATTWSWQHEPAITALSNGRFVVAWSDFSQSGGDTDNYAVRARIFEADGSQAAPEILVNTATSSHQMRPQITALPDGRFVASWTDDSTGLRAVRAQVFDTNGIKSGEEFVVAAPQTGQVDHTITALADGRFVIAWSGEYATGNDTSNTSIRAQIFDPREGAVNLVGTPLDDDLVGTAFNDTITGLAGDDRLDGGAGEDTAVFSQSADKYTLIDLGDWAVISGPDGTDLLFNFEHFEFAAGGPAPTPGTISGLFDTPYYLAHNTDVFDAKVSALDHFNSFGWHEGRNPNAWFDTTGYVAANPGVVASGLNPLDHYHQIGWREGRDPGAGFDTTLYLLHNPDVAAAGIDPLEHYMQHGRAEGRAIYQAVGRDIAGGFDAEWYLFHNPDVAAAGVDPLLHYNAIGWQEGRDPNAWFDSAGYLAHYTDVAAAGMNPLQHYAMFGWKEGRDPSKGFDTAGYLAANPDVAAASYNPLDHFLQHGLYEGRQAVNDGVWA